jgi:eukaryotic-like serine/threonine-protein kinase
VSTDPGRLSAAVADRYRIERELGSGGMATVYLAHDLRHDRQVAIKVLHPELAAVIGADRFLAEIRTTANLQHPHILPLFDSGHADGFLYYVMPHVEGETLRGRLLREKQLAIPGAVRIAIEVASALDYAHRHGVIHRDIKPENILLLDGAALVADFGIALAVTSAGKGGNRITETGMSVGTPQYMAPEQAMGERDITGRADIYALGAVTYEMLVGEPPFTGPSTQAILAKVLTEDPRSMLPLRRSIPAALETVVLTALEKLPADRFETAAELARALEDSAARGHTMGSGRATTRIVASGGATIPPERRSARSLIPLAAAAAAVAIAAFLLGARQSAARSPIAELGRSAKVTWDRGLEITPALSRDGSYVAYAAGNAARMRIFVRQVTGGRPIRLTDDSLDVQTHPSWSPDGSRILFLSNGGVFSAPSSGGAARPEMRPVAARPIVSAAWAPDGRTLAYAIGDSVYIRDADGGVRALARIAEASLCQWSPSGNLIACASGNSYYTRVGAFFGNLSPSRVVVVRVLDGATVTVADSTSSNQSPAWSPEGKWLYYVSNRLGPRDVYALRITHDGHAEGAPVRLTTGLGAQSIATSADGRRLAYAAYTETANLWSLPFPPDGATQASATPLTSGTQTIEGGSGSYDGQWFIYPSNVSGHSQLYRIRLPDGEPEQLTSDPYDHYSPHLSPDGTEVAFHSWRAGSRDVYVLPLDGGPVQQVTSSPLQEAAASWSPDGKAIISNIFGLPGGIWIVRRGANGVWGKPVERVPYGAWGIWSPDGRWIALSTTFGGGSLAIVDPDSGAPRVVLDSATSGGILAEMPIWSPDSRTIYFDSHDANGNASFWAIPATGGAPKLLARFDDPTRPAYRPEWAVCGKRMYFVIQEPQSDIWVMDATPR